MSNTPTDTRRVTSHHAVAPTLTEAERLLTAGQIAKAEHVLHLVREAGGPAAEIEYLLGLACLSRRDLTGLVNGSRRRSMLIRAVLTPCISSAGSPSWMGDSQQRGNSTSERST